MGPTAPTDSTSDNATGSAAPPSRPFPEIAGGCGPRRRAVSTQSTRCSGRRTSRSAGCAEILAREGRVASRDGAGRGRGDGARVCGLCKGRCYSARRAVLPGLAGYAEAAGELEESIAPVSAASAPQPASLRAASRRVADDACLGISRRARPTFAARCSGRSALQRTTPPSGRDAKSGASGVRAQPARPRRAATVLENISRFEARERQHGPGAAAPARRSHPLAAVPEAPPEPLSYRVELRPIADFEQDVTEAPPEPLALFLDRHPVDESATPEVSPSALEFELGCRGP
ncbi:hypothetical protein HWV62_5959 [Athelia sp. TMB]|nr:hypothetical protein HWV62_5959 [Athelia sp. TMB]